MEELSREENSRKKYSTLDLRALDAWTLLFSQSSPISQVVTTKVPSLKINSFSLGDDFAILNSNAGDASLHGSGLRVSRAILVRPGHRIFGTFKTGTEAKELITKLDEVL